MVHLIGGSSRAWFTILVAVASLQVSVQVTAGVHAPAVTISFCTDQIVAEESKLSSAKSGKNRGVAHDFVTTGQIGEALGISHQRVATRIREAQNSDDPFPDPEMVLPNGTRLWRRSIAVKWFERHPARAYRRRVGDA